VIADIGAMTQGRRRMDAGRPTQLTHAELKMLLGHQRTLFRRLSTLASRQRSLIVQDDARRLMELLAERQTLVDGLTGLSRRLAPYRENWSAMFASMDEAGRREVSALLEEANASLGTILRDDGRDCEALAAKRDEISQRLSERVTFGVATGAYVASASTGGGSVGCLADTEG